MKKNNKGFTLVELIVVIVILAILAAILVPALLGYIDKAKENQDMFKARNMLQATQTVLLDYYANDREIETPKKTYDDSTAFAKKVRETADDNPYLCIIGVGDEHDTDMTKHDLYTAYFVIYWESEDKEALFFNGSEWSMDYPWTKAAKGQKENYFDINGRRMNLKFIFVSNKTNNSNPWNHMKTTLESRGRNFSTNKSTKNKK